MTVYKAAELQSTVNSPRNADAYLLSVALLNNASSQLRKLQYITGVEGYSSYKPHEFNPEIATSFAEFAANPPADVSVAVRVEALERALEMGFASDVISLDQEEAHEVKRGVRLGYEPDVSGARLIGEQYREVGKALLSYSQLKIWFPDWYESSGTPGEMEDLNPAFAFLFLDTLASKKDDPLAQDLLAKFKPLLSAIQGHLASKWDLPSDLGAQLRDYPTLYACNRLLNYGDHYAKTISEIVDLNDLRTMKYIGIFKRLIDSRKNLAIAFPLMNAASAVKGYEHLLADALFATLEHAKNNYISQVELPLRDGFNLPLTLKEDEPFELLRALESTVKTLGKFKKQFSIDIGYDFDEWLDFVPDATILTHKGDGASCYRLIDKDGAMNAAVYIRPRGSAVYDADLEYGRLGEGVEASINFIVDPTLEDGELIEIGKHRRVGPDNRISIRLDREGVRLQDRGKKDIAHDPEQQEGTVSLDVGSVLGREDWLGTRLGRFLAWGNLLRTRSLDEPTGLNHVIDYFKPNVGTANEFARWAELMIKRLEAQRLTPAEVVRRYSGELALDSCT